MAKRLLLQVRIDSDEAQAVGLKKKSDRKRPSRKKPVAIAT
jgi:hypothetical protein